jgi:two-component system, OmpR family, alkaline phosphatase synthesis response regulator PhoP
MKKIMMVDDEPDQIYTLKTILESTSGDYELLGVTDGLEVLQLLKNGPLPDLIFLDIMMPTISGWELYEKIRENPEWKKIPIVFLTARTDEVAVNAGEFLGDAYINKPYDTDEILRVIKEKTDKK